MMGIGWLTPTLSSIPADRATTIGRASVLPKRSVRW